MAERFSVYFAGKLLAGQQESTVRANLARLFKADATALDKLFSGQLVPVKRDCDRATAIKYQQAMKQAGAVPVIKSLPDEAIAPKPEPRAAAQAVGGPEPAPPKQLSMAERLAAITGEDRHERPASSGQSMVDEPRPEEHSTGEEHSTSPEITAYTLASPGSPVLNPAERSSTIAAAVNIDHLELEPPAERLAPPAPPPPPAPNTSHLSLGAEQDVTGAPNTQPSADLPDISSLDLREPGSDLSDCAPPPATAPALDLSGLELGPPGADVLEQRYRLPDTAQVPDTTHLSLTE